MHEAGRVQGGLRTASLPPRYVVNLPLGKKWDRKVGAPPGRICVTFSAAVSIHTSYWLFSGLAHCIEKTTKLSDIKFIRDGLYELQEGHGDQTPGGDDTVQILFGGIQTASTSKGFGEKGDVQ